MPIFGGELGEVKAGTYTCGGTRNGRTPQGDTKTWMQDEGIIGGISPAQEMVEDTGTRCGAQVRAVEADGWRVREMPRWEFLCTGRGRGERVKRKVLGNERLYIGRR